MGKPVGEKVGFGIVGRSEKGTFTSVGEAAEDPWSILSVNLRRSMKERVDAAARAKGLKSAVWAREILEAALEQ
jgi:hypothetical protein